MRIIFIFLLCVIIILTSGLYLYALQSESRSLLRSNEMAAVKEALHCINMEPADMGFTRDLVQPQFVFPAVRQALISPLELAVAGRDCLSASQHSSDEILEWIVRHYHGLQANQQEPGAAFTAAESDYSCGEKIAPELRLPIQKLVHSCHEALQMYEFATEKLDVQERSELSARLFADILRIEDDPAGQMKLLQAGVARADLDALLMEYESVDHSEAARFILDAFDEIDLELFVKSIRTFHDAVYSFAEDLPENAGWPDHPVNLRTPIGRIYIGTTSDDVYTNRCAMIIDPDGNDRYADAALMANGLLYQPLNVVMDLNGDDIYRCNRLVGVGGALFGLACLYDGAGDDLYINKYAGQAGGLYGFGLLIDKAGNDRYEAHSLAQGASYAGVGLLIDESGNDVYSVGLEGQAYAGTLGVSMLVDRQGQDRYLSGNLEPDHERHQDRFLSLSQGMGMGMRPFAGGGIAALVDLEGNDTYFADVYGQGVGYWYALGMLLDNNGHDSYSMHHYGQGSGIHLSSGLLYDGAGNDQYNGYILSQGNAHDYAVGMLIDQQGDDTYTGDHHTQGRSLNNAFAMLLDSEGNDAYFARQNDRAQGAGNPGDQREYGCLALMLDVGGLDRYSSGAVDGARRERPNYGIIYDRINAAEEPSKERQTMAELQGGDPESWDMETVFFHASRYGNTEERRIRKKHAKNELMNRGGAAFAYLMAHIHQDNMWYSIYAYQMVQKVSAEIAVPVLLDVLQEGRRENKKMAIYFLGYYDVPQHADIIMPYLNNEFLAGVTVRTLGKWKIKDAVPLITPFLYDQKERKRILAVNALRDIEDPAAAEYLLDCFQDPVFTVRNTAIQALLTWPDTATSLIRKRIHAANGIALRCMIRVLGKAGEKKDAGLLKSFLQHADWGVCGDAVRAISRLDPRRAKRMVKGVEQDHPYVKTAIRELEDAQD